MNERYYIAIVQGGLISFFMGLQLYWIAGAFFATFVLIALTSIERAIRERQS